MAVIFPSSITFQQGATSDEIQSACEFYRVIHKYVTGLLHNLHTDMKFNSYDTNRYGDTAMCQ
jgi:hypothetical protein